MVLSDFRSNKAYLHPSESVFIVQDRENFFFIYTNTIVYLFLLRISYEPGTLKVMGQDVVLLPGEFEFVVVSDLTFRIK